MQEADEQGRLALLLEALVTHHTAYQIHVVYAVRQLSTINLFSIRANVRALYATFIKTGTFLHTSLQNRRS
jgi:hypothetical protein